MVFYVFFWVTGRIEFFSLFTLTRTSSIVEGLKPQVQGGFRSSEMATYVGLSVIFLLYCLHGADKKKSRVILFLLLGLSAAFLFILFSMGAFLAIGAVLGLYMIQKSGTAGLVKAGAVCLVAGLLVGLYSPSSVEVLREKVEEKLSLDLSQTEGGEGNRALRYALLLKTAVDNPVFGVGSQDLLDLVPYSKVKMRSNAPHQNILGIAAGCGVIAAIFYTLFVCSVTWSGFRALCKWDTTRSSASTSMRYLLFMAVGSFLFLQIHGLFLDTWQIKQVYLWAGITLGIVQRLDLNRKREMERSSAWSIQRGLFRRKRWKLA